MDGYGENLILSKDKSPIIQLVVLLCWNLVAQTLGCIIITSIHIPCYFIVSGGLAGDMPSN